MSLVKKVDKVYYILGFWRRRWIARCGGSGFTSTLEVYFIRKIDDILIVDLGLYVVDPIKYSIADLEFPR